MNCVLVDVGNTSTTVAFWQSSRVRRRSHVLTGESRPAAIAGALRALGIVDCEGSVLCSVVPSVNPLWLRELRRLPGRPPLTVTHRLNFGFRLDYPRPETLGADRLADACGAVARYGAPVLVADVGTALTVDLVDGAGRFVGGVIAPGPALMTDYMAERTALLPKIRFAGRVAAIGRSTESAMRIGARVGYRGLVREIVRHVRTGAPGRGRLTLCATGGYAVETLRGMAPKFRIDPDLTLYGLAKVLELN